VYWNYYTLTSLFDSFDRDFASLFDTFSWPLNKGDWSPSLDIQENKDELIVTTDLPGMKKEEIELSVENGVLTISGERKNEESKEEGGWQRLERSYGSFQRSVALPRGVDESKVKAEYKDGVLKVTLNKSEISKTKTIKID
jgi:HSP20 family protein